MALYQAKANRRGTYAIFVEEMESRLNARLSIEADLRVFSDWGCLGQAAPQVLHPSRGSLASLRGRRMTAA